MYITSFQTELNRLANNISDLQPNTSVFQYVKWLNKQFENKNEQFVRDYLPIIENSQNKAPEHKPFLTILTRTQGSRTEMLREVCQCLSAQTDMDFEFLLIGHKVTEEQHQNIQVFLDEQPESLRSRTRYLRLDFGSRTTPLNVGFANAYGEYIAVLDDDDLVFDHYVESFHKAANESPGTLLHAYVLGQHWKTIPVPEDEFALCATSAPDKRYCVDFALLKQLHTNYCPLMGIAFPSVYFQKYGFIFDESLSTTEDWDYIMRLVPIFGITDISEPTAIYRWWENTDNSAVLHNQEEWDANYRYIQQKYQDTPILIPAGQDKLYEVTIAVPVEVPASVRIAVKNKIRKKIPGPIWKIFKTLYRFMGGKKWLG